MRPRFFLAFLLLLAPFAAPAAAQPPPGAVPLDRLLPQIRRAYPGQFLDAEGVTANGSPHYHLKWLTPDGRVMWLDADARTGRIQRLAPGRDSFDAPRYREEQQAGPPPDRGGEGRFNRGYDGGRNYDAPRYDNRAPYGGPQAAPPQRERFNGGPGGYGNRGDGGRGYGGGPSARSFGGGRGNNRR